MRINIYSQELVAEPEMVEKSGHIGVRVYYGQVSSDDCPQSAITYWIPLGHRVDAQWVAALLRKMAYLLDPPKPCPIRRHNTAPSGLEHP